MSPPEHFTTNDIGPLLRRRFGRPVRKVGLRLGADCPHRSSSGLNGCIFCAEGPSKPAPSVDQQLAHALDRLDPEVAVIAYLQDHSATHVAPKVLDAALLAIGRCPRVVAVTLGTRPDCLPPDVLRLLARHASHREVLVELGLQSANDRTLRLVRRGHSVQCFVEATRLLHRNGLPVCAHVILGLPTVGPHGLAREGPPEAEATARTLAANGVEAVKLHNCHVLDHTALADLFRCGLYHPPDLEDYVEMLARFIEHLPPRVEVHRLMGEARRPLLIAPAFTAHKASALQRIRAELARRGSYQGKRL